MIARGLACGLAVVLGACAVGPNYNRPETPAAETFTRSNMPAQSASAPGPGGEAQAFVAGRDPSERWWTLFGSAELDALVNAAFAHNPTIGAAEAALRQAQELARAQRGAFFPQVQAGYSPSRQRTSDAISPAVNSGESVYTLHTAQVTVAYSVDVFGGNRRQVESLEAQVDVQRYQLQAAYDALISNVVAAAVQEASLRAQIDASNRIISIAEKALALVRQQFELGQAAGLDVAAQEAALAQARQALPPLEKQLEQIRNQLAVLAGEVPSHDPTATFRLESLTLPQDLPIGVPSRLVERRPDVRAAEAQVHAASAQIGVAVANMFPQFTINAAGGGSAMSFAQMFAGENIFWSIAGSAAQTIFAGGALVHRTRAARAAYDQSTFQYRNTVLAAFQNVADALYALKSDADALKAAVDAERATGHTLEIVSRQLEYGQVNYLSLLSAQQAYQQALLGLAQTRASRLADTAALFVALGGGWRSDAFASE